MCGIAGWIDYRERPGVQESILSAMHETMARRGPDAAGVYRSDAACLLHSRLIIIDPENGRQPMVYEAGSRKYAMVYNGELYNTDELRAELITRGHTFRGHSDTEAVLAAYVEWGEDCLRRLNGIFAFAVWEEHKQALFVARDRIGVKPLFFYPYPDGLLFSSEIKTLLAHPRVRPEVDGEGLNQLFLLGPGRKPGSGVFKNIEELLPGECMYFSADGLRRRRYWQPTASPHTDSREQTIERTRHLILDAVQRQLVSDVPLCCLLSGGLDSSLICAITAAKFKQEGRRLTTYSVDFQDNDRYFRASTFQPEADSKYIAIMTQTLGSEHRGITLTDEETADALGEAVCARDLPGMADIDSSLLAFGRYIKKDFTVLLSGECADELFGGYPWYHNPEIYNAPGFPWSRSVQMRRSLVRPGVLAGDSEEFVQACYMDTVNATDCLPEDSPHDRRMREMFMLNFNWFMQTLIDRKDRMTMYAGLEARVPYCDWRLVEYAYNMPWALKALNGREKGIIREAVRDLLPAEIVDRKKSPYPKTHNPAFLQRMKARAMLALSRTDSPLAPILNLEQLRNLDEHPTYGAFPWYGQLMRLPQVYAYLWQMDYWMRKYNVQLV